MDRSVSSGTAKATTGAEAWAEGGNTGQILSSLGESLGRDTAEKLLSEHNPIAGLVMAQLSEEPDKETALWGLGYLPGGQTGLALAKSVKIVLNVREGINNRPIANSLSSREAVPNYGRDYKQIQESVPKAEMRAEAANANSSRPASSSNGN